MALISPRFAPIQQCQNASKNSPVMRTGSKGQGVAAVQQGLIDLGFAMPLTVKRFAVPDGIYGGETVQKVMAFQRQQKIVQVDGVVGRDVMYWLDKGLPLPVSAAANLPYAVPGFRTALAQPTNNTCWATVYCMMRSWKSQTSLGIREAAALVGAKYAVMVDGDKGLPSSEFGPFIHAANMALEPMMNLSIAGWVDLLRRNGLIWVGTLNSIGPGAGLHSRIVEAMSGDGSVNGTRMHIIDPDGGRRYQETFVTFIAKYEGAIGQVSGDYFQIRHFR